MLPNPSCLALNWLITATCEQMAMRYNEMEKGKEQECLFILTVP